MRDAGTNGQHRSLDAAFEQVRQQLWNALVGHTLKSEAECAGDVAGHHVFPHVVGAAHKRLGTGLCVGRKLG